MRLFWLFLFVLGSGASCGPPLPAQSLGGYEPPACSAGRGPSPRELEEKKQDLFRDIEDSPRYSSSKARERAIRNYKNIIRIKERTACPEDVERMIENIARLHRR